MEVELPSPSHEERAYTWETSDPSAPRQGYKDERLCNKDNLLSHRNILLGHTLEKLRAAFNQTKGSFSEESKALLKVRVERANQECVDIKFCTGREGDVRRTYTLLNELEEEIIKVTAFINLHKVRAENKGIPVNQAMPVPIQCAFKNCRSTLHFTNRCDKNLTAGKIPIGILKLCAESGVCPRCLRDQSYWDHNRSCAGSYLRKKDKKWIQTDCSSCVISLPYGETLNLNRRVCHHSQGEANAERTYPPIQDENERS